MSNKVDLTIYSLYIKTVQSGSIKTLIEALKELLPEINIEFSISGIKVVAMDESHTVLVSLNLDSDKFDTFHCPNKLIIGVGLPNLYKIIKSMTQGDILTLYVKKDEPHKLGIFMENNEKGQVNDVILDLIELNIEEIDIPDHEYPFSITMPSVDFQKICRDMKNIQAKRMDITQFNNQLVFTAEGGFAKQITTRKSGNDEDKTIKLEKTLQGGIYNGSFNLEKLTEFTKCTGFGGSVKMLMKNEFPLIFIYPVAALGEIKLCLAPMLPDQE